MDTNKIRVNLVGFTRENIKDLARDIISNIHFVQAKKGTFDTVEFEAAENLLKEQNCCDSIDIYSVRLLHYLNKSNPIVAHALR